MIPHCASPSFFLSLAPSLFVVSVSSPQRPPYHNPTMPSLLYSTYMCIGKFSAVSFQVLGHMKTVLVLVLGWTLFDSALTVKNLGGMIIAVIGMIIYSWAVEKAKAKSAEASEGGNRERELEDIDEEKSQLVQPEKLQLPLAPEERPPQKLQGITI